MYYVVNFLRNKVYQFSDLNGVKINYSCDWYSLIPLQYDNVLILGHDHEADKSETDTYFLSIEKSRADANARVAFLLNKTHGFNVYTSQDEAVKDLKRLIDDATVENPNIYDLDLIDFYKNILKQIQAFKE